MPKFLLSRSNGWTRSKWLLQLDAGVGLGRPNHRDDVMVVQFFLEATRPKWGGSKQVVKDGACGSITIDAIKSFQTWVLATFNPPMKADSAVDPIDYGPAVVMRTLGWMHETYIIDNGNTWPEIRAHKAYGGAEIKGLYW